MLTSLEQPDHFLAAALIAASLKIFFTDASLKVIWALPEPISSELLMLNFGGGAFSFVSRLAMKASNLSELQPGSGSTLNEMMEVHASIIEASCQAPS